MNVTLSASHTTAKYGRVSLNGDFRLKRNLRDWKMSSCKIPADKLTFSRVRNMINRNVSLSAVTSPPLNEVKTEVGEGTVHEISRNIFVVTCSCIERLKFEVEYGLKRGTSENSYLIQGDSRDSTVLIDIPIQSFETSFVIALQKHIAAKKIGKILLTHLDPKSIPVLKKLVSLINGDGSSPVEIYTTAPALRLLEEASTNEDGESDDVLKKCELKNIKFGEKMELENRLELDFIRTATPQWPDMFAVYIPQRRILFSSKLFSAHVAPQLAEVTITPFDKGGWETYGNDWKYYFDTMLSTSSDQVLKGLKNLNFVPASPVQLLPSFKDVWSQIASWFSSTTEEAEVVEQSVIRQVSGVCPMHGPVIKNSLNELLNSYFEWLEALKTTTGKVAVFFASAYGNTAALAQAISHGISKVGVGVGTINLEIAEPSEVQEAINESNGFIIGSPTLGGHMPTQVQSALGTILRDSKAKKLPCGVFGSFGWSGEAVDDISQRLRDGGFKLAFDPIKVKFKPTTKDLQMCEESGTDLGQDVLKQMKKADRAAKQVTKARKASGAAQAIGRLVGTLCVISGKDGDAESGMLASWISQASFNPPGLTVAVKRDRALENVLMLGNRFIVNIIPEAKEQELVKHMLKPFKPGEDRFEGLASTLSVATDCVILDDAVSFLECTVKERMEAGDHWIIYAAVDNGSVLDKAGTSAVHHRTVGTNY